MEEARVRKLGLWLLGDAAGISGAWKALFVFGGRPLGVAGAGVKKGQNVWQVVPILHPSAKCGHPFLLLEHGAVCCHSVRFPAVAARKGSLGRKGRPDGCCS